ncbi:metallophosphatase [Myxococcaceae bacterium GXIMD 01537]
MSANVALYSCATVPGKLRVWLGLRSRTSAPALAWTLGGAAVTPAAVRSASATRTGNLIAPGKPCGYTGLYEFAVPPNNLGPFVVGVSVDGAPPVTESLRLMPAAVPGGLDRSFNVLLSSCFYWREDKEGLAGSVLDSIRREWNPDLGLLVGDQVYLDQPPLADIPTAPAEMAERFENAYAYNWFEEFGYAKVLRAAPAACVPDDHEYWNNYPHSALHIKATWKEQDRATWGRISRTLYGHFQHLQGTPVGTPVVLDVAPLSFFLLDSRSDRDPGYARMMSPAALKALVDWVQRCIDGKRLGIVVTGQSILTGKASWPNRRWGDSTLPNYGDYAVLAQQLDRLLARAGDVLLLTGDYHWGRVARLTPQAALTGAANLYEVVSSPTSLLSDSIIDDVGGILHPSRPNPVWPRHSDAALLGGIFTFEGTGTRYVAQTLHRQQGNQVCLLSFRSTGDGVEVTPRYYPLKPGLPPVTVKPFSLRYRTS